MKRLIWFILTLSLLPVSVFASRDSTSTDTTVVAPFSQGSKTRKVLLVRAGGWISAIGRVEVDTLKSRSGATIVLQGNFTDAAGTQQNFSHVQIDSFSSDSVTVTGNGVVTGNFAIQGGTTIGNASGDALTFHPNAWTLTNAVTITGTWTNLGTVTTVDINGGTADGVVIGGASAAAGTFTTVTFSGIAYGNETANSFMTQGVTLNQGANDDEIASFKSSDVAHSMTSITETDTYAKIAKQFGAGGGLSLRGYLDADIANGRHAVYIEGVAGVATVDSTDVTSSVSVVSFSAQNYDGGTGATTLSDAENAFGWYNNTLVMLLKGGGVLHLVNATPQALDEWDDRNLIRALERDRSAGVLISKWDNRVNENKESLIAAGVLSSDGSMLKMQPYLSLLGGGIWQNATDIFSLQEEVETLRKQIVFLNQQLLNKKPLHWGIKK